MYIGGSDRPITVPEIYADASGIQAGHVRVSPKYGGGFVANVEGLHHLHCLVRITCHLQVGKQSVD